MASTPSQVLVVGAFTADVFADETRPGGAVSYAARTASALGRRLSILTIGDPDTDLTALDAHDLTLVPDTTLTLAHSETTAGDRRLTLRARPSRPLAASDLPEGWDSPSLLILAPLLPDDIDLQSFHAVAPDAPRGLLGQGLQRTVAPSSTIVTRSRPSSDLLQAMTATTTLFLSAEETNNWVREDITLLIGHGARFVVTRGAAGVSVYGGGHDAIELDAVPLESGDPVDSTGAGDVFATAFMLAVAEGQDDAAAAQIASELAAAAVERVGAAPLPERRIDPARAGARPAAR